MPTLGTIPQAPSLSGKGAENKIIAEVKTMPEQFQCPACGAPLDVPENVGTTLRCPYCSASVVVPEHMRADKNDSGMNSGADAAMYTLTSEDPIMAQLRAGNKIEAIKLYRQRTGVGLKEAKDGIEAIQAGMTASAVEAAGLRPVRQGSARGGCIAGMATLVVLLAVGGIIAYLALSATTRAVSEANITIEEVLATQAPFLASPTPSGLAELVLTAGAEGTGAGKMTDARSVTQDRDGTIYAADYLPGRVQAFSAEGEFINQWALADAEQPLSGIAALNDGRVAVVTSDAVQIYSGQSGSLLAEWKDGDLFGYNDAWLMADGNLAVTRTTASNNDVLIFDMQGAIVRKIEQAFTAQTGDSEMEMKVASDLGGNLYLLGNFNRLVLKFDREGKFITRMGGEGDQPGQFTFPDDIAVDSSGRVYVSEGLNVAIFDPNGRYIDSFRPEGVASGLFVNQNDELLIAARSQVLKYKLK